MNSMTYYTEKLKRVWKTERSTTQQSFKTLELLLADKENFERIAVIREARGAKVTISLKLKL